MYPCVAGPRDSRRCDFHLTIPEAVLLTAGRAGPSTWLPERRPVQTSRGRPERHLPRYQTGEWSNKWIVWRFQPIDLFEVWTTGEAWFRPRGLWFYPLHDSSNRPNHIPKHHIILFCIDYYLLVFNVPNSLRILGDQTTIQDLACLAL